MQGIALLTIGHSTHTAERFIGLIRRAEVTAIADVRSQPYSRHLPQFNRDALAARLRTDGIAYAWLGDELGGRPKDRRYFSDGIADFELMAKAPHFQRGLARLQLGSQKYRIALMCAEQEPLDCHRCLLVARALAERGATIHHILPDSRIVAQSQLEEVLLRQSGRAQDDLFAAREERLATAYRERARKVAYTPHT